MSTADLERQILALIESSIEDTRVPDAIAAHAEKRAGKPVTKTDAEQLEAQFGGRVDEMPGSQDPRHRAASSARGL